VAGVADEAQFVVNLVLLLVAVLVVVLGGVALGETSFDLTTADALP